MDAGHAGSLRGGTCQAQSQDAKINAAFHNVVLVLDELVACHAAELPKDLCEIASNKSFVMQQASTEYLAPDHTLTANMRCNII